MNKLVLHPDTEQAISQFLAHPSHGLLVLADAGMGKATTAAHIASRVLGVEREQLAGLAYYLRLSPENNSIGIDEIRNIQKFLKLKTLGIAQLRRVILIEDAHRLTTEAQNALLKMLEEPPEDTLLILTAVPESGLLPTITSRVRSLPLQTPALTDLVSHFASSGQSEAEVKRTLLLSDNHIGLATALLSGETSHELATAIETAKRLIRATLFQRLAAVDRLAKQKEQLPNLLFGLERICHALLRQGIERGDTSEQLTVAKSRLQAVLEARQLVSKNPNAKLLLTDLCLRI